MLLVGLTGGIASGKSTVAALLAELGAIVVDADDLSHRALDPGTETHAAVLQRFGTAIADPSGTIDRSRLAEAVFSDAAARRDLESIIHPAVRAGLAEVVARHAGTDDVVVFDAALLVETGSAALFPVLVVVSASPESQIRRLRDLRGMSEDEARRRIGAQASAGERERLATHVLRNDGDLDGLRAQVEDLWGRLRALARAGAPPTD